MTRPFRGFQLYDLNLYYVNYNLVNNWTVGARPLIFHMCISRDITFPWVPTFYTLRLWPWSLIYFLKTLNLANNFCIVSVRALIFHTSCPCDKVFPCKPTFFDPVTLTLESPWNYSVTWLKYCRYGVQSTGTTKNWRKKMLLCAETNHVLKQN